MATKPEIEGRRARVLQMRAASFSISQIADQLRVSAQTVRSDLKAALEAEGEERREELSGTVDLELARLDSWTRAVETVLRQAVADGEPAVVLAASDRLVRISKRRSSLLGHEREGQVPGEPGNPLTLIRGGLDKRREAEFGSKNAARRKRSL